jgi:non-canonical purine NTP pyrophosphatase (RdgB/HAM1 family)
MTLYFITGNKNKFDEARKVIPELRQKEIDLLEIQETNAEKIIREKMNEAMKHHKSDDEFVIEDTSLYLECLNGLPGPLIKWFLESIGSEGLYEITKRYGNDKAEARTILGYSNGKELKFFEGVVKGKIVKPEKKTGFGWDNIFQPDGYQKPFVDMTREDKNEISMRGLAFKKLKEYLESKK